MLRSTRVFCFARQYLEPRRRLRINLKTVFLKSLMEGTLYDENKDVIPHPLNNEEKDGALSYFNYHEFLSADYQFLEDSRMRKEDTSSTKEANIVINHFPNNHVPFDSLAYHDTRVVRIPRIFDTIRYSHIVPQFSLYVPGREPAALELQNSSFLPIGRFDNNVFGSSSMTPLVPNYMSEQEFVDIVRTVNQYLYDAFNPFSLWNICDNLLDFLTANLYNQVFHNLLTETHSKRKLMALERYIEKLNDEVLIERDSCLKILSPRRSAYLSVSKFLFFFDFSS